MPLYKPVVSPSWQPSDQNLIAWSYEPSVATSSGTITPGVIQLVAVILRKAATITNVIVEIAAVGSALTTAENFLALYDSSGTRQGVTADQTSAWASTGVMVTPLATPYSAAAGVYYVAVLSNGSTSPTFARSTGITGAGGFINVGLTASTARFAVNGTAQTSMPSSLTLSSNSLAAIALWAGVS